MVGSIWKCEERSCQQAMQWPTNLEPTAKGRACSNHGIPLPKEPKCQTSRSFCRNQHLVLQTHSLASSSALSPPSSVSINRFLQPTVMSFNKKGKKEFLKTPMTLEVEGGDLK